MFTILIVEGEKKNKTILIDMLKREGYSVANNLSEDNVIKIVKGGDSDDIASLKNMVVKLEDTLYKEKHGILYKSILEMIEKPVFEHILERTDGNQLKAAKILGINRNTMRAKIKKLGIDVARWKT